MSEYTKGPWHISSDGWICGADDVSVSEYAGCGSHEAEYKNPNDKCLIISAPDLLEALEDMAAGWSYIRSTHGDLYGVGWDRAEKKATAAIARARGES